MNNVEAFKQLDLEYRITILELLRMHAFCERAAAQLFGFGIQFIEDLRTLKFVSWHITEEARHFTLVADLYSTHSGESVEPWVYRRLQTNPLPQIESFLDLGIAQWLFDLAGNKQMEGYEACSWQPYRTILEQILREERGHLKHGREIALNACNKLADKSQAQRSFEVWFKQALLCFGPPGTARDAYAVSVGIKAWPSSRNINNFIEDIRPAITEAGFTIPTWDSLGMPYPNSPDVNIK